MLKSEWEVIVDEFNQRTLAASSALPEVAGADPSSLAVRREVFRDQAYLSDAVKKLRSIPVLTYLSSVPREFSGCGALRILRRGRSDYFIDCSSCFM